MRERSSQKTDPRRFVRTRTPGVLKRGTGTKPYAVPFRTPDGKQTKRYFATLDEARKFKATVTADKARGEFFAPAKLTLNEYAAEWLRTYRGRTRNGIRPKTLEGYGDQLRLHVLPALGRKRLSEIGPRDIKRLRADLHDEGLADNSVRLALAPFKALLSTAVEDELIRRNPAQNVSVVVQRDADEDAEEETAKAMSAAEAQALVSELPPQWRLLVAFLLGTGLRIGEATGLQWKNVDLGARRIRVRRRWYRGTFAPPKTKFGRREVPITESLARQLWEYRKQTRATDDGLVFPSRRGTPLDTSNVYSRIYKPAAKRAGVEWVTFHTCRHTYASACFRDGWNVKQVQVVLGHHAASFTLDTYIHLLPDDLPVAPAAVDVVLGDPSDRALGGGGDHVGEHVAADADEAVAEAL